MTKTRMRKKQQLLNDPLGQTHSPDISNHYWYFYLKIVVLLAILKRWDGRTDGRTHGLHVFKRPCDCETAKWIKIEQPLI